MLSESSQIGNETGDIHFVLCQTADRNRIAMKDIMASAMDIAAKHDAIVMSVLGTLMMATFGFPRSAYNRQEDNDFSSQRASLADALVQAHGESIRVIQGCLPGSVGTIGTERRFLYGPTIPGINAALAHLTQQDFGSATEYLA